MTMESNQKAGGLLERRTFVRSSMIGLGTAGAAIMGAKLGVLDKLPGARKLGLSSAEVEAWSTITDTDILNFALNLEYLEAEFYTVAATGKTLEQSGIPTSGVGNSGPTVGGQQVNFVKSPDNTEITGTLQTLSQELMLTEQEHVKLLRSTLGADAIAKPAINLNALGTGFEGFLHFTALARAFEDVGVSAYGGAAPLITSKTILATAARIALTEAYHAGTLRLIAAANKDTFLMPVDKLDVLPPPTGPKYADIDGNGLSIVRTPGQVLAIVYHNTTSGASSGGFFPQGVNGAIKSVTA
jgi:Ferritin-like domain